MTMNNHPVDNIFSKGLTDFKVSPSEDVKKKLFSVPEVIKPIKPWYVSYKYLIIATPAILIISFFTYLNFNQTKNTNKDNKINNVETNNVIINKEYNNLPENNLASNQILKNSDSQEQEKVKQDVPNDNIAHNQEIIDNPFPNKTLNRNPSVNPEKDIQSLPDNNNGINQTSGTKLIDIQKTTEKLSNHNQTEYYAESVIKTNSGYVNSLGIEKTSTIKTEDRTLLMFLNPIAPRKSENNFPDYSFKTKKETEYHLKGFWFVEFKLGSFASNHSVISSKNEWQKSAEAKQKLLQLSPGNDFQFNAIYGRNHFIIKAGLSYVNYGEKLSGNVLLTNPINQTNISLNNNAPYDILIGGNYYNIDTLGGYYHYFYTQTDHIYISDSSWVWNTQNSPADVYDTTQVTVFDTLPENINYNNIRFLEIPVSIGFVKPFGKFSIGLSATVSPGLFLAVKGSNMSIESFPALEPYQKNTLQKFIISAGLNFEIGYQISETLMFSFEPFYKKSLNKLYNKSAPINQSFDSYGVRFGIRKLL